MVTKTAEKEILVRACVYADISAERGGENSCMEAFRKGIRAFECLPSPDTHSIRHGARLYHLYATSLEGQGNLSGAFQMYRRSLRWRPSSDETWERLAAVSQKLYGQTGDDFYLSCRDEAAVNARSLRRNSVRTPPCGAEPRMGASFSRRVGGL